MEKEADEDESHHQELVKQGVRHHNEVLCHGDERGPLYRMRPLLHYPLHSHTRPEAVTRGRAVFAQAGCADCHAGAEATNHRVIPGPEIGTGPSCAQALQTTEPHYVPPSLYGFDTPVPIPPGTPLLAVPAAALDPHQLQLAFAYGGTLGGYKVPSLVGVYWSAPYRHDGGVAVRGGCADAPRHPGHPVPGHPPGSREQPARAY
jgi:hypothetical protein